MRENTLKEMMMAFIFASSNPPMPDENYKWDDDQMRGMEAVLDLIERKALLTAAAQPAGDKITTRVYPDHIMVNLTGKSDYDISSEEWVKYVPAQPATDTTGEGIDALSLYHSVMERVDFTDGTYGIKMKRNKYLTPEGDMAIEAALLSKPAAVPDIPHDILDHVKKIGRVEWGATDEKSDEKHTEDFASSLRITREHFKTPETTNLQGVYLENMETILCHTGTSPNSAIHARILTGLWNYIHDFGVSAPPPNDERGG